MISVIPMIFLVSCLVQTESTVISSKQDRPTMVEHRLHGRESAFTMFYDPRPVYRYRRHPAPALKGYCGKYLPPRINDVCKGPCNPGTNLDISTVCCATKCSDSYIKEACCPDPK